MDTRWCASKDAGSRRRWIGGVTHRLENETSVSEDVGPKVGWIVRSISVGEENKTLFIRVWKLLPSRHVEGSPKGKIQI